MPETLIDHLAPAKLEPEIIDTLPRKQRYAYLLGVMPDYLINLTILNLALPIYNVGLGISAVWIGWALFIPRLFDAIIDPMIGNLTDNTRTRWGRRRPYLFGSTVICSILFALIWMPPTSLSKEGLFLYFLSLSMVYFIGYAFYNIAYNALGLEIYTDTYARGRLMSQRMIVATGVGVVLPWLYKLCLLPIFGGREVVGVRYVGSATALIVLITGLLPAIICRERTEVMTQPKIKIRDGLRMTFGNRPFIMVVGIATVFNVGLFLVSPVGFYINLYYVCNGSKDFAATLAGYGGTLFSIIGIFSPPFLARLAERFGKKQVLLVAIVLESFSFLSSWVLYNPNHPYWQLLGMPLNALGCLTVATLTPAMLGDICDLDELKFGLRREGMFSAVNAFIIKASLALTTVLGGYLLKLAGTKDGVVQSAQTILWLRVEQIAFPLLLMGVTILFTILYPITEKQVKEARALLDQRKASTPDDAVLQSA